MKNRILTATVLIFLLALGLYFWTRPGPASKPAAGENKILPDTALSGAPANQDSNTAAIIASNFARVQTVPATAGVAPAPSVALSSLQFTNFSPAIVLENVSRAVRQYGAMFGGNPVGDNSEITAALNGDNPKHIHFLNAEAGMRVNGNGELVDPWGTPYFFHQLSGTDMEIHSAGPDKIMWTSDDVVAK